MLFYFKRKAKISVTESFIENMTQLFTNRKNRFKKFSHSMKNRYLYKSEN